MHVMVSLTACRQVSGPKEPVPAQKLTMTSDSAAELSCPPPNLRDSLWQATAASDCALLACMHDSHAGLSITCAAKQATAEAYSETSIALHDDIGLAEPQGRHRGFHK